MLKKYIQYRIQENEKKFYAYSLEGTCGYFSPICTNIFKVNSEDDLCDKIFRDFLDNSDQNLFSIYSPSCISKLMKNDFEHVQLTLKQLNTSTINPISIKCSSPYLNHNILNKIIELYVQNIVEKEEKMICGYSISYDYICHYFDIIKANNNDEIYLKMFDGTAHGLFMPWLLDEHADSSLVKKYITRHKKFINDDHDDICYTIYEELDINWCKNEKMIIDEEDEKIFDQWKIEFILKLIISEYKDCEPMITIKKFR